MLLARKQGKSDLTAVTADNMSVRNSFVQVTFKLHLPRSVTLIYASADEYALTDVFFGNEGDTKSNTQHEQDLFK